jgi:3-hydroxyacyl-CoA dehydrogenase
MAAKETDQYLANWHDELNNAVLYQALAEAEKDSRLAEVYRRLATVEQRHADTWAKQLQSAGITVPAFQPTWRTRTLNWLAQRFGVGFVLPSIVTMEEVAGHAYNQQAGPAAMVADEQSHARLLRQITPSADPGEAACAVDLLSESAPEDPELKARVLAQFNALCPLHTIFTTNTSTLIPSMFAAVMGRPAQFAAFHFHHFGGISMLERSVC